MTAGRLRARQGREGQNRRACKISRQKEPAGRAVRQSFRARRPQIAGECRGQRLCLNLVQLRVGIGTGKRCQELRSDLAGFDPGKGLGRPVGKALVEKRQVKQPLARIIHDIKMHGPRPRHAAQKAGRLHPQRQAQLADRSGAFGPVRRGAGQSR